MNLDDLIARARQLDVRPEHASAYVADLARWTRRERELPQPRRWPAFLVGFAAAATIAAVLWLVRAPSATTASPTQIGDRVAILASAGSRYAVAAIDASHTEIAIERGAVTAHVFPGASAHSVVLRGGGVQATGTDTLTLAVDDRGNARVSANAGSAVVQGVSIEAGQSLPAASEPIGAAAASRLATLEVPVARVVAPDVPRDSEVPVPVPVPVAIEHTPVEDARQPAPQRPAIVVDAGIAHDVASTDAAHPANATTTVTDRWRSARLFRSQGKFDAAIAECVAIADSGDRTWAPIALVEAARIELGPLAAPERAIAYVDRFTREWPGNELDPEARDLRCRALTQLGRGAECTTPDAGVAPKP
ncbi:MAG TPA: hypothetical protein VGL61_15110 [Kofleriaceae bacterium]